MLLRLLGGLGVFVGSMAAGWWLGRTGRLSTEQSTRMIRRVVQFGVPVLLTFSFWRLDLTQGRTLLLPVIGAAVALATLLPSWWYCRRAGLTRPQTGAFLDTGIFSNLGYLGAFVAFALYGEEAYGLAALHLLYFSPCFYAIGFTIARRFGHLEHAAPLASGFSGELRLYPLIGMIAGMGLNLLRVPRPHAIETLNHVLIPAVIAVEVVAIAAQLRLEPVSRWWRPCLAMSAIKFIYSPLIGWALVTLLGLTGLPRFIVLLQSAMPVGVSVLMLPGLFGLDRRLTAALWLCTTAASIPWLLIYLPLIR